MPNIREAGPIDTVLRPSETGVESVAAAGRRLGGFYNQAAGAMSEMGARLGGAVRDAGDAAVQYMEHREISHGAAAFAGLTEGLTKQWNDVSSKADPNDPTVAGQFHDQVVEPALDKFRSDGFLTEGGQKWAESHVDALRQHLYQKTDADMSQKAADAVAVNHRQMVNSLSNNAMNDPSSLDFSLKTLESSTSALVGSSPNLKGEVRSHVSSQLLQTGREAIVKSAAFGYIQKTGQMPPWANDPKYAPYINGMEFKQLEQATKTQQRTNFLQQKQIEDYHIRREEQAVHAEANKVYRDNVTADPGTGEVTINPKFSQQMQDILNRHPDAPNSGSVVKQYQDWQAAKLRQRAEPAVTDPDTAADLMSHMTDPENPTTTLKVLQADAFHKLNSHDSEVMQKIVKEIENNPIRDPKFKMIEDAVKERLGFTTVIDGRERYARAMMELLPEYARQKNAGSLQPNALDLGDEKSLLRQTISKFEPNPDDKLRGFMARRTGFDIGPLAPEKPSKWPPDGLPGWSRKGGADDPARQYRDAQGKLYDKDGNMVR